MGTRTNYYFLHEINLFGSTNNEVKFKVFWRHNAKERIVGEDPNAWRKWRQLKKRLTEDKLARKYRWWHKQELKRIGYLTILREMTSIKSWVDHLTFCFFRMWKTKGSKTDILMISALPFLPLSLWRNNTWGKTKSGKFLQM